ncbi:MAG: hypothetical protein IJF04_02505 [Oscillospiraceae bacterium]|nr:hypothetical protein [Oscillospiraceae bacterium]
MNITYKNPGYEYSIESIMLFQTDEQTPFWSDSVLYFYPQIDKTELEKRNFEEKKEYIYKVLEEVYGNIKDELESKIIRYNEHFQNYRSQIEDALSEAFELDSGLLFNDLTGNITMNPVCPRFLQEKYFDVFYLNSERGALGLSIHEVIHYFWFYVWNKHFGDSYEEYETPSLKWILSEMVVEAIMSDERLSLINPYFPREDGGCVYPYFFDMIINGKPVLDKISELYKNNSITDFMEASYAYCLENENEIRNHIEEAEKEF